MAMLIPLLLPHVVAAGANIGEHTGPKMSDDRARYLERASG
jgi:hypothetical protein